jgi:DNA-directed RNA polymerase subunit M/transcription elongation factor TFIIS
MEGRERECENCGTIFIAGDKQNRRRFCCIDCKIAHQKRMDAERYQREREERKEKREAGKSEKEKTVKRHPRKKGPSVVEIAVMARKEHLSYGQWVARHEYGMLEDRL